MKQLFSGIVTMTLLCAPLFVYAESDPINTEVLAQRGKGVVTQSDFGARADKIPESARQATLRDGNRVRDLINTLLLRAQLVADAREAAYDQDAIVTRRMALAAEAELANAWVQHYVEMQPPADYEQLAYEAYQLNQGSMLSTEKVDVSHILVSTEERTDEDALALAESLHQQLLANPGMFEELVTKHSDDPSAASNHGSFKGVKKGDMVKAFEETAFTLEAGAISGPVKTNYGYHIIRLDAHKLPERLSFEEVKPKLIKQQKSAHDDRIKRDYLSGLTSLDVEMTQEALEEMVKRQFGEDYIDAETVDANSE